MEKNAAPRAMNSAVMHIAALRVPVKMYTATVVDNVAFKQISPSSMQPVKQKLHDPLDDSEISRDATLKGYEVSKGEFVIFTKEEVEALETERDKNLNIKEFVPLAMVDFLYVEKSYYLGPDKSDQAFALVMQALKDSEMVAIGQWAARGKEQLVLIRPYGDGMIMHQLFHAHEVRNPTNIGPDKEYVFGDAENGLMSKLVAKMSAPVFKPEKYKDQYSERVKKAVAEKQAGTFKVSEAPQVKASVIDLAAMLSLSLNGCEDEKPKKKKAS